MSGDHVDLAMFEEYLQDAHRFYEAASVAAGASQDREARRYFRAAVFYIAGSVEAFVNYLADAFQQAGNLTPHELAFLDDKIVVFSADKDQLIERVEFHSLEAKLRLLIRKFMPGYDFNCASWGNLMSFKHLRDSLTHPRQSEDGTTSQKYKTEVRKGMAGAIDVMSSVSMGILKKPLRQKILDLIPE